MRSVLAVAKRILLQFAHDKRTLGLLFVAPMVVLWLLTVLLGAGEYVPRLAAVDLPAEYMVELKALDCIIEEVSAGQAENLLRSNQVDAVLSMNDDAALVIWAEGSDSTKTAACRKVAVEAMSEANEKAADRMKADVEEKKAEVTELHDKAEKKQSEIKDALESLAGALGLDVDADFELPNMDGFSLDLNDYLPVQDIQVTYLHGNDQWKMFDFYGPVFIGIFLFAFVFITSGMSLVNERSSGTMRRFLATPIKPAQILGGYVLGFGAFASVQATVVLWFSLSVMNFPNEGNVFLVVLVAVLLALVSVTMGLLVSGLASSAFQVIQLMLVFVVPQILLSGLFDLSVAPGWLQTLSLCFPTHYGVDALRQIMLRGAELQAIGLDIAVMCGFVVLFFVLASIRFRKKRAKA